MATRRVLKSALNGFLGTYKSRYSNYDGYWLFGFLVEQLGTIEFDLLGTADTCAAGPLGAARRLAIAKFAQQVGKSGLELPMVRDAKLRIERMPGVQIGPINGNPSEGFRVHFLASATSDTGSHFERDDVVFVAIHNPAIEFRSGDVRR